MIGIFVFIVLLALLVTNMIANLINLKKLKDDINYKADPTKPTVTLNQLFINSQQNDIYLTVIVNFLYIVIITLFYYCKIK